MFYPFVVTATRVTAPQFGARTSGVPVFIMSNVVCSCCSGTVERHLAVFCGICKKPFKGACVGLSSSEIRKINEKKRGLNWDCSNCGALGQDIRDLKAVILSLQAELHELKASSLGSSSQVDFEEFMQEFDERQSRKSNIIIFGVPEQDSRLESVLRLEKEKTDISNLVTLINPSMVLPDECKVLRLGRFNPSGNKPRPIRVNLEKEALVHDVVRKFKAAKSDNNDLRHISISFDRTPRQLDYLNKLRSELKQRQENGEDKLTIKFFRGVPRIISLN